jgi:hypothetical protein
MGYLRNFAPNDGTNKGVFCADISAPTNSTNGKLTVTIGAEGICQNVATSVIVRCANIDISYGLWTTNNREIKAASPLVCGHNGTLCSAGRTTATLGISVPVSSCEEVWTVVSAGSTIELPKTGDTASLGTDVGSGHITICP